MPQPPPRRSSHPQGGSAPAPHRPRAGQNRKAPSGPCGLRFSPRKPFRQDALHTISSTEYYQLLRPSQPATPCLCVLGGEGRFAAASVTTERENPNGTKESEPGSKSECESPKVLGRRRGGGSHDRLADGRGRDAAGCGREGS